MMHDFQLARGDICGDPAAGQRGNIDIHGYVHFAVIGKSHSGKELGNMFANRKAA
jgi:hypothetical protein